MIHILVVDDESEICDLVRLYLERENFKVDVAYFGNEALELCHKNIYDLLVADIMMPGMDGYELVRNIRKKSDLPILMLSARDTDIDKAVGLGIGADDYLTKPFSPIEFTARVKALLRRYKNYAQFGQQEDKVCQVGKLKVDLGQIRVWVDEKEIKISAKEFELLKLFITHPGHVFTKVQIFERVWGNDFIGDDNTVMVTIRRLRAKIEPDPANPIYIRTVWSIGYRLEGGS